MSHYVVAGAGVAGLTIGRQLSAGGHRVTVLEKLNVTGGLARSWHYGDFHFDVGPHRFHTENARVAKFVSETLGEAAIEISRKSGVRMFGGFHEWPLRPSVLLSMPFSLMASGAVDMVRRERLTGESFEADIVNKYGRTLYSIFFEPYTRKFLFHSPAELHRDWGRAGVNRAVIDKRAQADSLFSLLKTTLLPKPVETTFLYAPHGVGAFAEKLAANIVGAGGAVRLGRPVTAIDTEGPRISAVRAGDERIACDGLIWTGPLTDANALLGVEGFELKYLSTIFYNLEIDAPAKLDFQWTYFGGDEIFSRISTPTAFAASMAPPGKSGLCVEVTCRQGDERWQEPDALIGQIITDLVRTETIDHANQVLKVHIERVPFTYPIYTLDYLRTLTANLQALGKHENLLLAGRSARFWYNNMDHSIGQGLTMADKILRGDALAAVEDSDREFWNDAPEPAVTPDPAAVPAAKIPGLAAPVRPVPPSAVAGWARGLPIAAASLGAAVLGLSGWLGGGLGGVLYLALYLLALVPGLPVGFALFGRRHAAGWVAGALAGYILTAFSIWGVIAAGGASAVGFGLAWSTITMATWTAYRRFSHAPLVPLPEWTRRDTVALLVTLSLVPILIGPAFANIGALNAQGAEHYRAYFTADFLWHGALTAEIARFNMPVRDPYAADQTLNYYWTYFLLPGGAFGTNPFGIWPRVMPLLQVNALLSGILFIASIALFVWSAVPRAWAMFLAVALSLLSASLEGLWALYDLAVRHRPLDALRHLNVDALTSWNLRSLTIDGLPRSLWYTPQHAMAVALGSMALITAGRARGNLRWPAAALAGLMLGGAVMASPFLGGAFSIIYGLSVAFALSGGWRAWIARVAVHASAAVPVALAVLWCSLNHNFDGAGAALKFGFIGPITRAPFLTPLLALGPLLLAALAGALISRRVSGARLATATAGTLTAFGLFYFVTLPGGDLVWIGWRAGQILLVMLPALAAVWFAWSLESRRRMFIGVPVAVLLLAVGLPTTVIDLHNAQDIANDRMGPGFKWTVVVSAAQRRAAAWIRQETAPDAIVQMAPTPRGRETWTFIPTFAHRRMAAGLPISLLKKPIYDERTKQVHAMYGSDSGPQAWTTAQSLGIDYIYVDRVEHDAYGASLAKFDRSADLFKRVYDRDGILIFEVLESASGG